MLQTLLRNHVLANLLFGLVLVIGVISYQMLPRQQDPTINFNWILITTVLPGASASDIEKRVTDPLEDALTNIDDINFMSSNSRESISTILIRFEDISTRLFDKRVADLRREIQNAEDELPEAAEDSKIIEITSANAFPSSSIVVVGQAYDENLRSQAYQVSRDIERIKGVDRVDTIGLSDPEIQILFDHHKLEKYNINPLQVAETVQTFFQDTAAGTINVNRKNWLVRIDGANTDIDHLKQRPIIGASGEVLLKEVATIKRSREKADKLAKFENQPAVLMAIMKKANANTLTLVDRVKEYLEGRNKLSASTGVRLVLTDDQTVPTRSAIDLMQTNALIGLGLVLVVAWIFLGPTIALLTAIGIPFILAGTFWVLSLLDQTLNVSVLLGVVIVLGMLVDDAVVVVEAIYYRLRKGVDHITAVTDALHEVARPVTTAVLTTMATFLPLMLLPGILGDFMRVIPMVVSIALAISLVEAFWMLPAHVLASKVSFSKSSKMQRFREHFTHRLQITYTRILVKAIRYRWLTITLVLMLFAGSLSAIGAGMIKLDLFAADPLRIFYINVEMPPTTRLQDTLAKTQELEKIARQYTQEDEVRAMVTYSGIVFLETEAKLGDHYGQVLVGLRPKKGDMRSVSEIVEAMRAAITAVPGPRTISFLQLAGGPPKAKAISIKVRGNDYEEIRSASIRLKRILADINGLKDITDDASQGRSELVLKLDNAAIDASGVNPQEIHRTMQLLVNGLVVAETRDKGEKVEIRVQADNDNRGDFESLLNLRLTLPDGRQIPLSTLVTQERQTALGNIRHYDFRRAITVEADIDQTLTDTIAANKAIVEQWQKLQHEYPDISLDFSGELDDIQESLDAIAVLFLFGIGLIYLILGTQFSSYWQPLIILSTIPMAFTGVIIGVLITGNALSLFTLYGVVALAGIAVNAAIVLVSAANARLQAGMSVLHATLYAARRRVIPVFITSLTTIAGLFSLATGLGGKSLIWGPVANAIVWGLAFSTVLTLIVIPLIFSSFAKKPSVQ